MGECPLGMRRGPRMGELVASIFLPLGQLVTRNSRAVKAEHNMVHFAQGRDTARSTHRLSRGVSGGHTPSTVVLVRISGTKIGDCTRSAEGFLVRAQIGFFDGYVSNFNPQVLHLLV